MSKESYVLDPETKKLVPKDEYYAKKAFHNLQTFTINEIRSFVSPIDGTIIDSPGKLKAHNKKHGVTNIQDYGPEYFERKAKERDRILSGKSRQSKQERINVIMEATYKSEFSK